MPSAETFEPCNHPGTPTYGMPSSNKLHFQAGETLHYSCQNGHQLLGEPLLYCVPGHPSQWSGLPPVCKGRKLQHDLFLHCQFIFQDHWRKTAQKNWLWPSQKQKGYIWKCKFHIKSNSKHTKVKEKMQKKGIN